MTAAISCKRQPPLRTDCVQRLWKKSSARTTSQQVQMQSSRTRELRPRTSYFGVLPGERAQNLFFVLPYSFWDAFRCGKTTMARVLISRADAISKEVSPTTTTANEVRSIFEAARDELRLTGRFVIILSRSTELVVVIVGCRRTIVFLDEIHRFTRSQQVFNAFYYSGFIFFDTYFGSQDVFIPFIEQGFVQVGSTLSSELYCPTHSMQIIGATTENPSFEISRTLLNLCR